MRRQDSENLDDKRKLTTRFSVSAVILLGETEVRQTSLEPQDGAKVLGEMSSKATDELKIQNHSTYNSNSQFHSSTHQNTD
jgi:hypothetical protein